MLEALLRQVRYVPGSFDDPGAYERLTQAAEAFDEEAGIAFNRVFYLSTAPAFFPVIVAALGAAKLHRTPGCEVRVVIEKPFGYDLESARALNRAVLKVFRERQVFRIDHYLGKETVQNLLAFRFANAMFEPVWNRNYIDSVQITAVEDIGIGTRAGYYDSSGALRDLVQNHMLQLLALLCMEPPATFSADKLRDEKVKVTQAIRPPTPDEVARMAVRAQYGPGVSGGDTVPGYLDEAGVPDGSTTETYAALRLEVSNWRWAGVPFYLRTGKRLARRVTEIAVILKPVPHLAFQQSGSVGVQPNQLILTVQPDEGVSLSLGAKIPDRACASGPVNMEFRYGTSFLSESPGGLRTPDPRRHARGRVAVHARGRGGCLLGDLRPDPEGVGRGTGPPSGLCGRIGRAHRGGRAARGPCILEAGLDGHRLERRTHVSVRDRGGVAGAASGAPRRRLGERRRPRPQSRRGGGS